MTAMDKRKLITEIKAELKPFITQLAELSVTKTTQTIKSQVRTLQGDLVENIKLLSEKLSKEIDKTKTETIQLVNDLIIRLEYEVKLIFKAMARNKSDADMQHQKSVDVETEQRNQLATHDDFFNVMA